MKATELRIGNILSVNGEDYAIAESILYIYASGGETYKLNGIPLTPEWLEKFGFEKDAYQSDLWYIKNGDFLIIEYPNERLNWEQKVNLIHVHQLQNLYFALTGEELTLKS